MQLHFVGEVGQFMFMVSLPHESIPKIIKIG